MTASDFPDDADGDVLRRLVESGNDLSQYMVIDFHVLVPDADAAEVLAELVKQAGFKPEVWQDEDSGAITVQCSKLMLPEYEALIDAQVELGRLAQPLGGEPDGWGTFGNAES